VYFQTESLFSEDEEMGYDEHSGEEVSHIPPKITFWPAPSKREKPEWLWQLELEDETLYTLLQDTYSALNNDLRIFAAIGLRTALDRASELLKIDPAMSFYEKLNELQTKGHVGKDERDSLGILTDAGNAAAHRGWKPNLQQLGTLMSIAEQFLYRAFIIDQEAKRLKTAIPSKPKPAAKTAKKK
jgi:hypothetical protein